MKNINRVLSFVMALFAITSVFAQDDVYDAPRVKKVKVQQTSDAPSYSGSTYEEKTAPYYGEESSDYTNTNQRLQISEIIAIWMQHNK